MTPQIILAPTTTRLALGRTTGTPGTRHCNVDRALFHQLPNGTFTCHVYQNGTLIHHETRELAGAQETLDCLTEIGYEEVL